MDLLMPILKSTVEQSIASDMKEVVTIEMLQDAETQKNELVADEPLPAFEDKTLTADGTLKHRRISNVPILLSAKLTSMEKHWS